MTEPWKETSWLQNLWEIMKNLLGKLLTSNKVLKLEEADCKQDLLSGAGTKVKENQPNPQIRNCSYFNMENQKPNHLCSLFDVLDK